ncbi:Uncharacterised protein (plasmid) [Tsukamurella tyrosinosolvens]|uniref:Glycine betaine/proline transport system substrate-binding protein n=1 Tax=Tsukamurella tyrosinosolvens TaxID=57704 RepID=A0A1H4UAK7_TSUTY|nr:hypothetical protein [Tsukamurella tyrosinosolvens]KXO92983.1 hypothetical protein AXK58_14025 [Tsukamurella tyrosinosolvens]SEC65675.1 glycine betaine/proline transport system substrate-binding protein [Tsukamurella tyrosinosolvens]VEH94089.1 Uncharacterised protein [Tsukamurella tyrosinosolvens]
MPAAAAVAVAFWALKPIFITLVGDRAGFTELYLASAFAAAGASSLIAMRYRQAALTLIRAGRPAVRGAASAATSGLALALWYYGFYRALFTAPKVDATVIAFLWPLIAAVAVPLLSTAPVRRLTRLQWALVLVSFGGAVAVAAGGSGEAGGGFSPGIAWAFAAAVGSGIYLPFALNATAAFDRILHSKLLATFFAVSIANGVSLLAVAAGLTVTGYRLDFARFDGRVLGISVLIGVGTYVVAELAWTWAFRESQSLALTSLPYFSPAVSVLLLFAFFGEPVRPAALGDLVVILGASLVLHVIDGRAPAGDTGA